MAAMAAMAAGGDEELSQWEGFLDRMLPQPGVDRASIHNDELEHDAVFSMTGTAAEREAALAEAGWDGLPAARDLKGHMLRCVEYEYAEHLHSHGFMPGERVRRVASA